MAARMRCLILLIALGACTAGERESALRVRQIHSWTATAEMTAEAWGKGEVPARYARATLQKARAQIAQQAERLSALPPAPAPAARVLDEVPGIERALDELMDAVARGDRQALHAPLCTLARADAFMASLTKSDDAM